jgi:hypothetical protein
MFIGERSTAAGAISHSDRRVGDRGLASYRLVTSIFIQYWLARQKVSRALVRIDGFSATWRSKNYVAPQIWSYESRQKGKGTSRVDLNLTWSLKRPLHFARLPLFLRLTLLQLPHACREHTEYPRALLQQGRIHDHRQACFSVPQSFV